ADSSGLPINLTVSVTDANGCPATATASLPVRTIAAPVIHLNADAVCPGAYGSAYIDSPEPVNGPNGWSTVHWTIDHGTINYESGSSVSFSTDATGLPATLTVTATGSYGCTNSASAAVPVRVLTPPAITTASPDVCPTSEVHATVAPPDVMQSWSSISWSATNARITSINANSADIFAMATGDGPVTLTVTVMDTN